MVHRCADPIAVIHSIYKGKHGGDAVHKGIKRMTDEEISKFRPATVYQGGICSRWTGNGHSHKGTG